MKSAEEIIKYLENELKEAYAGYEEWININKSEAMKYRIKANTIENILDDIDPFDEAKESAN